MSRSQLFQMEVEGLVGLLVVLEGRVTATLVMLVGAVAGPFFRGKALSFGLLYCGCL